MTLENDSMSKSEPEHNRRALLVGIGGLAAGAVLSRQAHAGPLDPPLGPIAPTSGPEPRTPINSTNTPGDASSLFKITQPGSYYLAGNITGVSGKHGIAIASSGVTLDLNGFDLVGLFSIMGAFDGVSITVLNLRNITVLNGSIRNWGGNGINLEPLGAANTHVEGVLSSGNTGNGIQTSNGGSVTNSTSYANNGHGIDAGTGSTVLSCTAWGNAGSGVQVGSGSTVSNCTAYRNTSAGIHASAGSTISNCSAYDNLGYGINVNLGCTISGCTIRSNKLDGIQCSSECLIYQNTCSNNGNAGSGSGIYTFGNASRIEGNNSVGADYGVKVNGSGNIVLRNTCSGNTTNWSLTADNVCGPIIDRTAPGSANISGNSAPDSTGSAHPNANFSY